MLNDGKYFQLNSFESKEGTNYKSIFFSTFKGTKAASLVLNNF